MNENFVSGDSMGGSLEGQVVSVLIDKTVENGKAIAEVRELVRKLNPDGLVAEMDQRFVSSEERMVAKMEEGFEAMKGRVEVVGKGVATVDARMIEPSGWWIKAIKDLQGSLDGAMDFFSKPMTKEVHYRYFLGRPLLVLGGMFVVLAFVVYGWINAESRADLFEKNDLLWRAVKLKEDSMVTRATDTVEREYQADAAQMRRSVVAEEQRRKELFENLLRIQEGQEKMHQLEKDKRR